MNTAGSVQFESRRGITLVEMLITLSLLSLLVLVSVSWMTTVISRQNRDQQRFRWDRAVVSMLEQVDHDLMQIEMIDQSRRRGEPRVWISDGSLHIRTTEEGRVATVSYRLRQQGQRIDRVVSGVREEDVSPIPLVGEVRASRVELHLPDDERVRPELHLTIEGLNEQSRTRVYTLNREDVRQ